MIRRALFDEVGLFDESLPACEDYDLWLRIAWRYPVYTTPSPLVVKHGGHEDQLSRTPLLDRFRIQSLVQLLNQEVLSASQAEATRAVLQKKGRIYAGGCLKHGREAEARAITRLVDQTLRHITP
jgi:GT2 family glycosyltransferase